jgi:hypothetical protein
MLLYKLWYVRPPLRQPNKKSKPKTKAKSAQSADLAFVFGNQKIFFR